MFLHINLLLGISETKMAGQGIAALLRCNDIFFSLHYKDINLILPLVLYCCETHSLTPTDKRKLQVLDD
jgi:hypothetical protein